MSRRLGFTLLELLVVLALIALVAGIAIPFYFSRAEVTLENAAVLLAKDLRAAQNQAAYAGEHVIFEVFEDGDGYWVLDALGHPVTNPATGRPFVRRYSVDGVFRGVVAAEVDLGGDRRVIFDERGRALEGGSISLRFEDDERVVLLREGDGRLSISGTTSGWVDDGL